MKTITLFIALLMIAAASSAESTSTLRAQLEDLNKEWVGKLGEESSLDIYTDQLDNVSLIKKHLFLVEQTLRNSPAENLDAKQLSNRMHCLDILSGYREAGNFPKNLFFRNRTPVFIDPFNTACAVGYLIIATGHGEVSYTIAKENNFAYVKDLNKEYPQLSAWAAEYGFTVDELAWIQPGYPICDTACVITASIYTAAGQQPYTYAWSNGDTLAYTSQLCPGSSYTCIVTDALGNIIPPDSCSIGFTGGVLVNTNTVNIPAPVPFFIDLVSTDDPGGCHGTASVDVIEGNAANFYWTPGNYTAQVITDLCPGMYHVTAWDFNGCFKIDSVEVGSAVGINEKNAANMTISPNPAENFINITLDKAYADGSVITIRNYTGQILQTQVITGRTGRLDLSDLPKGIYVISVHDGNNQYSKSIVRK